MSDTKRSKRHRRHRDKKNKKDSIGLVYSFAAHAKKVSDEHKRKYKKEPVILVAKGFEYYLDKNNR